MQRLLVSVRGPIEAVAAARGGAHIADVEYPASALGTPYPLNIRAVRDALDSDGFASVPISTNIGEDQPRRSTACQAALGVAIAGAHYVKCGLAGFGLDAASYLGRNLVRTVRTWCPEARVVPAVFPEEEFAELFDPLEHGPALVEKTGSDALLIDTYQKEIGKGLQDYYAPEEIARWTERLHDLGKEAWIAGSLGHEDLAAYWQTGVDVICVRGAACESRGGDGRFGEVSETIVRALVETIGE